MTYIILHDNIKLVKKLTATSQLKSKEEDKMKTENMNMEMTIKELYTIFNKLNETFYNNELPEPQIVVTETAKKGAFGWFTPYSAWSTEDKKIEKFEIALSAEYMTRKDMKLEEEGGMIDVIRTLHHEMIHLFCHINDIKDTSRQGRYHNKNFKKACEDHGFIFKDEAPDSTIGWSRAYLSDQTKAVINSWNSNEDAFKLARVGGTFTKQTKEKKPSSTVSYMCPKCEEKLRAKREMNIMCGDCDEQFEEQE